MGTNVTEFWSPNYTPTFKPRQKRRWQTPTALPAPSETNVCVCECVCVLTVVGRIRSTLTGGATSVSMAARFPSGRLEMARIDFPLCSSPVQEMKWSFLPGGCFVFVWACVGVNSVVVYSLTSRGWVSWSGVVCGSSVFPCRRTWSWYETVVQILKKKLVVWQRFCHFFS